MKGMKTLADGTVRYESEDSIVFVTAKDGRVVITAYNNKDDKLEHGEIKLRG
jgi:hypothetical protein